MTHQAPHAHVCRSSASCARPLPSPQRRRPSLRALVAWGALCAVPAATLHAVYAPIPEQEQGKALVFSARAATSYDSNIFGAPTQAIDSAVFSFTPKATFNASVIDQTFVSAFYQLSVDHFTDRPGDKTIDSHELYGRLAHAFSSVTNIDFINFFQLAKNPESLLAGAPINSDQSYQRNQFDARFTTGPTEKSSLTLKYRHTLFDYRHAMLGRSLDRTENLYGLAGSYQVLPETKAVLEYRHQQIDYWKSAQIKDKTSDFALAGVDYRLAEKVTASARLGWEWRHRDAERFATAPTAEATLKYDYSRQSFFAAGYSYALEETSNVDLYTDSKVHRLFANVQHALTAKITASGSLSYEPSVLQGRRAVANVDETTVRAGAGLSYLPNPQWTLSATYDHDRVRSDDKVREMKRDRVSFSASYSF